MAVRCYGISNDAAMSHKCTSYITCQRNYHHTQDSHCIMKQEVSDVIPVYMSLSYSCQIRPRKAALLKKNFQRYDSLLVYIHWYREHTSDREKRPTLLQQLVMSSKLHAAPAQLGRGVLIQKKNDPASKQCSCSQPQQARAQRCVLFDVKPLKAALLLQAPSRPGHANTFADYGHMQAFYHQTQ